MLTIQGPETLRRLDKNVLQQASKAISEQLRADKREDGDAGVHLVVVVHYGQ